MQSDNTRLRLERQCQPQWLPWSIICTWMHFTSSLTFDSRELFRGFKSCLRLCYANEWCILKTDQCVEYLIYRTHISVSIEISVIGRLRSLFIGVPMTSSLLQLFRMRGIYEYCKRSLLVEYGAKLGFLKYNYTTVGLVILIVSYSGYIFTINMSFMCDISFTLMPLFRINCRQNMLYRHWPEIMTAVGL